MKLDTIKVERVYTEMIKPSQNVKPYDQNPYKLCVLDQLFGLTYVPQVLFYNNNPTTTIPLIKELLSKALSMYYPLAGRLSKTDNQSTVNCNDQGVSFLLAQTNCSLDDYLQHPSRVDLANQFLPPINTTLDAWELVLLAIQVTEFSCGGIAVGSQYLHKVLDGASWGNFLKTWAAFTTARSDGVLIPDLEIATLFFPPSDEAAASSASQRRGPALAVRSLENNSNGTCVGKAFAFSAQSIRGLQDKCRSEERVVNPTRIEAISAFFWKHTITAAFHTATTPLTSGRQSVLIHSVNMRSRTTPPLPSSSIGNLITHSIAYLEDPETKSSMDLPNLVNKVRKSVSEVKDPQFLAKFQGDEGYEAIHLFKEKLAGMSSKNTSINTYKFTSWSGLGVFPDFGLGLPVWCGFMGGRLSALFRNLVVLIENPVHRQNEAWLILDVHEMNVLQFDPDFLEFAFPIV